MAAERHRYNPATVFQIETRVNVRDFGAVTRSAVSLVARRFRERGRQDIASAGKFPRSFISGPGLTTQVKKVDAGWMMQAKIWPSFMKMYEYGGTSTGAPFLWLPVPPLKVKVHKYGGKLMRLGKKGNKNSRAIYRVSDRKRMYVGVSTVTNRQRLHLRQIALQEAQQFRNYMDASS